MKKKTVSTTNGVGKTGPFSYTIHKNKFKMHERPKCEIGNHQNPREEHQQKPLQPQL